VKRLPQCTALALVLAASGAPASGCGSSSPPGSSGDASADGEADSGALWDGAAPSEAPADASLLDAGSVEDADAALPPDAQGAATGKVVVSADASLQAVGSPVSCAAATSLLVEPTEIFVGDGVSLTASGIDADGQDSDVTLTWTSTGSAGSLAGATGTSNTFDCTAAGVATVTVTATISGGGASCPVTGSLSATVQCDSP